MGTEARIVLFAPTDASAERAARAAFAEIASLDALLSDYRADSELSRLGAASGRDAPGVRVSRAVATVLGVALALSEETRGAFDVTAGPVVELWREARARGVLPSDSARCERAGRVGWRYVELDMAGGTVRLARSGMRLDVGAIGKGYAADRALAALGTEGIDRALVSIGGDLVVGRAPPGDAGWRVSIPRRGRADTTMVVEWGAVSTSGDTEQFAVIGGVRYSHVVDPRTGVALTRSVRATVHARTGIDADAWATAVTVLSGGERADFVAARAGRARFYIDEGSAAPAPPPRPCALEAAGARLPASPTPGR